MSIRTRQNCGEGTSSAAPPQLVNIRGKQMVQPIVSRGDGGEHFTDGAGGGVFVGSSFRRGAADRISADLWLESFRHEKAA